MYANAQEMIANYHAIRARLYGTRWIEPTPIIAPPSRPSPFQYVSTPTRFGAPLRIDNRARVVMTVFCRITGQTREEIWRHDRAHRVSALRWISWRLLREHTGLSLASIGRLGGFDHTSLIHGISRTDAVMEKWPDMRAIYEAATKSIGLMLAGQTRQHQFIIEDDGYDV